LALLTVVGLLVYAVIQRQVRLSLRDHDRQIPGNKGLTATPTAAGLAGRLITGRVWDRLASPWVGGLLAGSWWTGRSITNTHHHGEQPCMEWTVRPD
jgi:hypothetical protein